MVLSQHLPTSGPPPAYVGAGLGDTVLSAKPIVLAASAGRGEDLLVKVSAPATGQRLPVILFSHGYGSSLEGYGPLTDYWAAHGFVVVQPTFLDSRTVGIPNGDPRVADFWRFRIQDVTRILDELDTVLAAIPGLAQRVDRDRIAAAGHSFGGQTTGLLLGLRVLPPSGANEDLSDARVSVGVLIATAGNGGDDLSDFGRENLPHLNVDFSHVTKPALVVAGDADRSPLTVRGADWSEDPFHLSPGADQLLTIFGGEHSLGGIPGYEAAETTDENRARLGVVQQLTWAYLRTALGQDDSAWPDAVDALRADTAPLGTIQSK